jgi:glycosyltransferase involved in cell wall biosynthesis
MTIHWTNKRVQPIKQVTHDRVRSQESEPIKGIKMNRTNARVLFISTRFPTDFRIEVQGIYQRMRLFLDAIANLAQVDLLFYVPPDVEITPATIADTEQALSEHWQIQVNLFLCPQAPFPIAAKLRQQTAGIFNFFRQGGYASTSGKPQLAAFERCLDRQPDAIFAHRLESMCPAMLTQRSLPPIYFDLDDIEHIAFMRQIRQPPTRLRTSLYYLQIPMLWRGEQRAIRLANHTFVCSNHDRDYLVKRCGLPNVVAVPNAIRVPEPQPLTTEPTLLLLGAYHYYPNINAANFLIEQVWPHIQAAMPEARLLIAGKEPHNIRSYGTAVPGVEFTGFVDDLDALYRRSRVVCCPILSGGGTRVKMIEAAAYGKPIVATQIGAEGLELVDGQDFWLRNDAGSFADACLELLRNQALCQQLGASARATALNIYDRAKILHLIQEHLQIEAEPSTQEVVTYAHS